MAVEIEKTGKTVILPPKLFKDYVGFYLRIFQVDSSLMLFLSIDYYNRFFRIFNNSVSLSAGSRLSLLFLALNLLYGLMVNHTYFHFKYIMLHRSLCIQHFLGNPFCFFPCIPLRAHAVFHLHIPNKDIPVPSSIWITHIP